VFFFFQAEDGIRDYKVTGVQTCALPIYCSYGITPSVCAPKKSRYQTVRRPSMTGRFRSNGADRKCSSMAWKPPSIARKCSGPIRSEERRVGKGWRGGRGREEYGRREWWR